MLKSNKEINNKECWIINEEFSIRKTSNNKCAQLSWEADQFEIFFQINDKYGTQLNWFPVQLPMSVHKITSLGNCEDVEYITWFEINE